MNYNKEQKELDNEIHEHESRLEELERLRQEVKDKEYEYELELLWRDYGRD